MFEIFMLLTGPRIQQKDTFQENKYNSLLRWKMRLMSIT